MKGIKNCFSAILRSMISFLLLFFFWGAYAQNLHLGLPVDQYYEQNIEDYKGATINDKNELLLIFNNSIYRFNGYFEELFRAPEKLSTLSFKNSINYGSYNSYGTLYPDSSNFYKYKVIFDKTESYTSHIVHSNYGDFILSKNTVFHFNRGTNKKYSFPGIVDFMSNINGSVIIHDDTNGLSIFVGGRFKLINNSRFLSSEKVVSIEPLGTGEYIVATRSSGLYRFDGENFTPFAEEFLNKKRIRDISFMSGDKEEIIVITENNELLSFNTYGSLIQEKLYPYPLLDLHKSIDKKLFVITTKGIHVFHYDLPFQKVDLSVDELHGPISIFNNNLYWGTNNGLFYSKILENKNLLDARIRVKDTEGKVGKLDIVNGTLLMSHEDGLYDILPKIGARFIPEERFYNFQELERDYMIGFGNKNNYLLKKIKNKWRVNGELNQLPKNPKAIVYDKLKNIWLVDRDYNLIHYKFNPIEITFEEIETIRHTNRIDVFNLNGNAVLIKDKKPFVYKEGDFVKDDNLNQLFGDKVELEQIINDPYGNVWYIENNKVGVIKQDRSTGKSSKEIINFPHEDPRSIYPYDKNNIFINNGDHYIKIDFENYVQPEKTEAFYNLYSCKSESGIEEYKINPNQNAITLDPGKFCSIFLNCSLLPEQSFNYKLLKDDKVINSNISNELKLNLQDLEQGTYVLKSYIEDYSGEIQLADLEINIKKSFINSFSFYLILGLGHIILLAAMFFLGTKIAGKR